MATRAIVTMMPITELFARKSFMNSSIGQRELKGRGALKIGTNPLCFMSYLCLLLFLQAINGNNMDAIFVFIAHAMAC